MKKTRTIIAGAALMAVLLSVPATAQSTKEIELAIEGAELDSLPPGLATEYRVGDRIDVFYNGARGYHEVTAVENGFVTFHASYGCEWRKRDLFSPPVEWHNCDGRSGTQEILSREGSPWPLIAGKTFSYTVKGSDSRGNTWRTVQRCRVEGMFSIFTYSGEHKTYKVVCNDDWLHQIWYWSPALREYVKYLREQIEQEEICNTDMLGAASATGNKNIPFSVKGLFKNGIAK